MQATRMRSVAAVAMVAMVLLILALVVLFAITNSSASAASVGRRQTMAGAASFLIAFPTASATSTPFPGSTPAPTSTPLGVEPAIRLQAQPDSGNDIGVAVLAAFFGDPFVAYKVHVRWDPRLFRFRYLNYGAQLFARDGAVCVDPTTSADADGGGIIFGCLSTLGPVFGGGSLANIRLTAVGSGCSPLHVVTLGPPDGGDGRMGSYFVRADGLIPERGSYSDSTSDETGTGALRH